MGRIRSEHHPIFKASAPGSLMLFGEHAVLQGKQALCCAIDQRINVSLQPRADQKIHIFSSHLGEGIFDLSHIQPEPPFQFVLTALQQLQEYMPTGLDLNIQADFGSTMGLGSSSAVTVATLGVLNQWLELNFTRKNLFQEAKEVILKVQGVGSGADAAAAVYGGIIAYQMNPLKIEPLSVVPSISLVYSGSKVPTRTVIQIVSDKQRENPNFYEDIYNQIDGCSRQAVYFIKEKNWPDLGKLMSQHHNLQISLGVSTALLNDLVNALNHHPDVYGAKISGSGLGDCVVALGQIPDGSFPSDEFQEQLGVKQIPVKISNIGYQVRL